ncbi:hypothetical protein [Lactiplantibacillus plantarum]
MMKVYLKQLFQAEQFDGSNEMIDKYELIDAGTSLELTTALNYI